jgi:hypothetical protein
MERHSAPGLERMEHVAAAIAAGYVVAGCTPWDPAAPLEERAVAQEYWRWCAAHRRPFVLIQSGGAEAVSVVLDAAPLGRDDPGPDAAAVSALLCLATAPGFVTTGQGFRPDAVGPYWCARAVPARLAPALAQELLCLAARRGGDG